MGAFRVDRRWSGAAAAPPTFRHNHGIGPANALAPGNHPVLQLSRMRRRREEIFAFHQHGDATRHFRFSG